MTTGTRTQAPVLCVDLDGTLIDSDLLWEAVARFLSRRPYRLFALLGMLLRGRSYLKRRLAERVPIDMRRLAYKTQVVERVRNARSRGESTVLVTASPEIYAQQVADHLQLFDTVLATGSGAGNLAGNTKARALVDRYGERGFVYVGDSRQDLAVWRHASKAIAVDAAPAVVERLASLGVEHEQVRTRRLSLTPWVRQLRVHQWVKNLLVLVPLLTTSRDWNPPHLVAGMLMFAAFCLLSSATYIWNDLSDLDADRAHATKRNRPLAASAIAIPHAMVVALVLAVGAVVLASRINLLAVGVLAVYLVVTVCYTAYFKRLLIADVIVLAGLYTVRVVAGCAAIRVHPSVWLMLFSVFVFFSLALLKRCAEIISAGDLTRNARGYLPEDRGMLLTLGVTSGIASVLVFGLYIHDPTVDAKYQTPVLLWLIIPLLLFWISRIWLLTGRGAMHDDPVIFTFRDRVSRGVGVLVVAIIIAAAMIRL